LFLFCVAAAAAPIGRCVSARQIDIAGDALRIEATRKLCHGDFSETTLGSEHHFREKRPLQRNKSR
jgi:hypothetical protein